MTRINPVIKQPFYSAMSKSAIIANLKMEIAELKNKMDMGLIPFEEGHLQVLALEAKLNSLECGISVDGKTLPPSPALDLNLVPETSGNLFENDFSGSYERQQNLYFNQEAIFNRAFHNI